MLCVEFDFKCGCIWNGNDGKSTFRNTFVVCENGLRRIDIMGILTVLTDERNGNIIQPRLKSEVATALTFHKAVYAKLLERYN